jgi:hypothetical protein
MCGINGHVREVYPGKILALLKATILFHSFGTPQMSFDVVRAGNWHPSNRTFRRSHRSNGKG